MTKEKVMNRWLVVLGAILIQLCLGALYAWSVFTPALKTAGWTKMDTQIVFAVGSAVFAIVMVLAGKKLATWSPRKLTMASGIILGAGYAMAGIFGGTNFWSLLLFIGFVSGTGIGIGYVVPIAVGMRWFPDKKGMITGLAVAGFGFGAMGWVKLAGSWGHLIADYGLSTTFVVYGVIFTSLVVLGGLWMVFPPEGWVPEGYIPPETTAASEAAEEGLKGIGIIKTYQFKLIFLTFVFSAGAGLMSIGLMKLYPMEALQAAGYTTAEASAIAGTAMAVFFSLANGIGRIAWGMISDLMGRKVSLIILTATQGLCVIAFPTMAGNELILYVGAAFIGFNYGGIFSLFPTLTADIFGVKNVGLNYPFVFLAYGVGGIGGPILGGYLGDLGNFPMAFTTCGVLCLVGSVLTWHCNALNAKEHELSGFKPIARRLAAAQAPAKSE
ncbi:MULTISPECIES: OFA family MFS transporter [unclassified Pseudodesulfovibrio]|uniref:L-lactate MFS transporter n=1 Tax=unclassified Pseudodesulfovibrio TaxID=2661612 RepID=UPI000FEBF31A|nr:MULTISPECIES: OFA family MFS transporter [unclassified Pseudodesulfovibrio]MCJ2164176.1 OFA family MFS transporter [Pseudodesulfovibrio sp. S3-i]RWU05198.1 MFS transporter [Pseudodesulfovibrio sp. S3]